MKKILIGLVVVGTLSAQSFVAAAGASYGTAAAKRIAPWVSFGLQVNGSSNVYSFTTVDFFPSTTSLRTGAAYAAWRNKAGSLAFFGSVDAGATTTPSATVGSFSGGPMMLWRRGRFLLLGRMRVISVTGSPIRLVPEIGIGWAPK